MTARPTAQHPFAAPVTFRTDEHCGVELVR
jgi:hypothetical protein